MTRAFIIGGKGNYSDSNARNAGQYDINKTTWDNCIDDNGGPIVSSFFSTITNNGVGDVRILITDTSDPSSVDFSSVEAGMYAYVDSDGIYATDYYEIKHVQPEGGWIDIELDYTSDCDVDELNIGGAWENNDTGIQRAFTNIDAGDYIKIATDTTTASIYTLASTIDVNGTNTGTAALHITVEGVDNTDGTRVDPPTDVMPIITTSAGWGANGLIKLYDNKEYYDWYYLDFDGGGAGEADYCIDGYISDTLYYTWTGCKFHNSSQYCLYMNCHNTQWYGCEIYDSGKGGASGDGFYARSSNDIFVGCSFHDNFDSGVYITYLAIVTFLSCLFYDNGEYGIELSSADSVSFYNCVMQENTLSGFIGKVASDMITMVNCTSSGNGEYGFEWNGSTFQKFAYNHSYNNTSGHSDQSTAWADAGNGNNITGDPLFTDAANGDFTPQILSPLLNVGFPPYFAAEGDIDAYPNYASIGAFQKKVLPSIGGGFSRGMIT